MDKSSCASKTCCFHWWPSSLLGMNLLTSFFSQELCEQLSSSSSWIPFFPFLVPKLVISLEFEIRVWKNHLLNFGSCNHSNVGETTFINQTLPFLFLFFGEIFFKKKNLYKVRTFHPIENFPLGWLLEYLVITSTWGFCFLDPYPFDHYIFFIKSSSNDLLSIANYSPFLQIFF